MSNYDDCTIYAGPALISGRGDSDSSGVWVKFSLPAETGEGPHPFRGYSGKAVQLAVVLCDDNGEPQKLFGALNAPSVPEKAVEPAPVEKAAPKRSSLAAMLCKNSEGFQAWLVDTYWTGKEEIGDYDGLLKRALGITSKTEIDNNPDKAEAWERMLTTFKHRHTVRA